MRKTLLLTSVLFLLTVNSYSQSFTCGKIKIEFKKDSISQASTITNIGVEPYHFDRYPSIALEKGIQGTVIVGYEIDDNCQIKNVKIIKGLGYGLDEIALENIKCIQLELDKIEKKNCFELKNLSYPIRFMIQETTNEKPVQKSNKSKKRR